MKQKLFTIVLLTLLLCFCVVFTTSAAQASAKDKLIDKTTNYKLNINKGFYSKSSSDLSLDINKFDGDVSKQIGDLKGSKIGLNVQLDDTNKIIKINYDTKIKGDQRKGEIYLKDDKVILTKDILPLLESFNFDTLKGSDFLQKSPQYLYFISDQLKPIWEQLKSYQHQQLPEGYTDMLLFLLEAMPDNYVSEASDQITIQLNQAGFEDFVYSLLNKIIKEKVRFADIVYNLSKNSFQTQGVNPETIKQQIISNIENSPSPTQEDIHEMSKFADVNLTYTCSVLPNGSDKLAMNIAIKSPYEPIIGNINISTESTGGEDQLKGSYAVKGYFDNGNDATIKGDVTGNYNYQGTTATSDFAINALGKDNNSKALLFDIGISAKSTDKTDPNLMIKAPEINATNSLNITQFIPTPDKIAPSADGILNLFVNGKKIDCDILPNITEKGIMLPVRFVSEALGYQVDWDNLNEVRITGNGKVITLFVGEETYKVNDEDKQLDLAPYVEKSKRTMVLIDFITNELGATVNLSGGNIYITN